MNGSLDFEFPLSEFLRTCLKINRINRIFIKQRISQSYAYNRNLLFHVLELHNLVSRPELKNELIKEIEKKILRLNKLKLATGIDASVLSKTLSQLNTSLSQLKIIPTGSYSQPLPYLIDSVKQRSSIPGGQFEFDLPMFHFWLQHDKESCSKTILNSISVFQPIIESAEILLNLLRQSATSENHVIDDGAYQITNSSEYGLLIISLDPKHHVYPEISGGRHRVFIRFLEYKEAHEKPQQHLGTIEFKLTCCKL